MYHAAPKFRKFPLPRHGGKKKKKKHNNNNKQSKNHHHQEQQKQRNEEQTKVTADILKGGSAVDKDIALNESFGCMADTSMINVEQKKETSKWTKEQKQKKKTKKKHT